jgi:hypothetical protein
MSLAREGEGKREKGDARRPKMQEAGRRSVGYGLFDKVNVNDLRLRESRSTFNSIDLSANSAELPLPIGRGLG